MHSNYIQITIDGISEEQSEMLIAQLSELGFDGFEEQENSLKAFTTEDQFPEEAIKEMLEKLHLTYSKEIIAAKNWNEEWEKNFEPVLVDDFVAVRADFHEPIKNVQHEIIITPKMSFGTGHHATTYLMMQQMGEIDFKNKTVFDFGTGTGILAILAEKLGAKAVYAIDNDEWSIENAEENAEKNNCRSLAFDLIDDPSGSESFDIILANINKNVIITYISVLSNRLHKDGQLLLSGLLIEDEEDILQIAKQLPLKHITTTHENKWICLMFSN
jgi:ribosomal protein L11 methyltransferase